MFNLDELYKIEIELTTRCQASCPMCSRNFHGLLPNTNVKNTSWSYEDFKKIITLEILNKVKVISFCGAYGDPLICRDIIKICSYVKENSKTEVRINTNGSLHNATWWKSFASSLPKNHILIFGIDGFKENHEKHRIGTDFNKIIQNARSFIDAGGHAVAQYINFEHNVDDFENLKTFLIDIGFKNVFQINSDRFRNSDFAVLDKNKKEIYKLKSIDSKTITFKDLDIPKIIDSNNDIVVSCRSIKQKEIYIDAYKHLYPCCEVAAVRYEIDRLDEPNFNSILPTLKKQITQIYKDYNNLSYIDLNKVTIKEVITDPKYLITWQKYWDLKKSLVCSVVCGEYKNKKYIDRNSQFVF